MKSIRIVYANTRTVKNNKKQPQPQWVMTSQITHYIQFCRITGDAFYIKEKEPEHMEKTMWYPKRIMRMSELERKMGFPHRFLLLAYRSYGQDFAWKINPQKRNSPIVFDTEKFEKYRLKTIKASITIQHDNI